MHIVSANKSFTSGYAVVWGGNEQLCVRLCAEPAVDSSRSVGNAAAQPRAIKWAQAEACSQARLAAPAIEWPLTAASARVPVPVPVRVPVPVQALVLVLVQALVLVPVQAQVLVRE